jgi:hypothetical protein
MKCTRRSKELLLPQANSLTTVPQHRAVSSPLKIATDQGRAFLEENISESLEVLPRSPVYRIKRIECRSLENQFICHADSDVSDGKRTRSTIVRASRVNEVVANAAQCHQGMLKA